LKESISEFFLSGFFHLAFLATVILNSKNLTHKRAQFIFYYQTIEDLCHIDISMKKK